MNTIPKSVQDDIVADAIIYSVKSNIERWQLNDVSKEKIFREIELIKQNYKSLNMSNK